MSEYIENEFEYELRVERLSIIIYSLYAVIVMYVTSRQDWGMMVFMVYLAAMAVCWSLYLTKSMTFRFRATVNAVAMLIGVYIYSVISGKMVDILPILVGVVILIGLYEIPELIVLGVIATVLLYLHHILILDSVEFGSEWTFNLRLAMKLLAVFVTEYAAYYLVNNQRQARQRQSMIIQELKDAEQSREDFLSNVSHELRTPINTINGMSEMLLRDQLTDKVRQEVFNIQAASKNLLSIVSDILDYSELQGGQMELIREEYNITSTINDVINMSMAKKGEKNIEFVVDCDPYLPHSLKGDEQKIRRVIMNLINNAIKYTQTGCVALEVYFRKEDYGINLTIGVRDTGIGMTKADIEKLFSSFGQIDTRRNRKDSGIGLGLAISSAIVNAMGGFISVESEYGTGTHIQFSIPQEVADENPIIEVEQPEKIRACLYFNMEQFDLQDIRDVYGKNMEIFEEKLGIETTICRNLGELKRRVERNDFTHIFISIFEYKEDMAYFDKLSEQVRLIVTLEQWQEQELRSPAILRLYKPFYVLPAAIFLNNREDELVAARNQYHHERFVAPDAHILIVDDNLLNIKVAEGLLKPYMIKTSHALSGKEALEMVKSQKYDFIFMDHMMPEMDGIECLDRIRTMHGSYYAKVPVIALTANAIGGTREMFLEKGFADFVAKPIELSVLERVLRRNLPKDKIMIVSDNDAEQMNWQIEAEEAGDRREKGSVDPADQGTMLRDPGEKNPEVSGRPKKGQKLVVGDLDVEQGETYCGGEESYIEILKIQAEDEATLPKIINNYENENWKDYVILVHGVKSTMKSIGAQPLSDMAKALEAAGKAMDVSYIHSNQEAFLQEYRRVQAMIQAYINGEEKEEKKPDADHLPEISDEEFQKSLSEFESAMYAMDDDGMREIIKRLERHRIGEKKLDPKLKAVLKKIDMADYFSAYDTLEEFYKSSVAGRGGQG